MCGIVGGVSNQDITPLLIKGLKRLEYRGYDSSGLAVLTKNNAYVAVNFILHADPRFRKMKEEIKKNKIGNIVTYFARRRGSRLGIKYYAPWTDLLSSTLIHDIQMIIELSSSTPDRVFAEAVIRECKKYNSHDAVIATLRFFDGSIAAFERIDLPKPLGSILHILAPGLVDINFSATS